MRLSFLFVVPAALFVGSFFACGGQVDVPGAGQPGPGPTGTTTPTGTSTTPGTPPTSTPTSSPTSTSTSVPPSPACLRTSDYLGIVVSGSFSGSCAATKPGGPSPTPLDFTGEIVAVGADFIQVDTCPPTADCAASLTTISLKAAGLDLSTLPVKSLVRVTASFTMPWGCESSIHVESVAEWDGMKNPVDAGGLTYFAGSDGTTSNAGAPFEIALVATGCGTDPGSPGCGGTALPIGDYAMTFRGLGDGSTASIPMGSSARFMANGQVLEARNLRAFNAGYCDEYWDYAYWAKASVGKK